MVVIVTGTPGTGKTTFARELAEERGLRHVNITNLLEERGLDGEWDGNRNCFLVDVERLTEVLTDLAEGDGEVVIDGHLSHYLPPQHVDECYVTKCDLPELKERLEERGYSEEKVRENMDCEIFDVCAVEAAEFGHDPAVVWTSEDQP